MEYFYGSLCEVHCYSESRDLTLSQVHLLYLKVFIIRVFYEYPTGAEKPQ